MFLPRKTPITDREYQNECFWNETRKIENALEVMNSIARRSAEDIAYSEMIVEKGSNVVTLLLKNSKHGTITKFSYTEGERTHCKQKTFCYNIVVHLSELIRR